MNKINIFNEGNALLEIHSDIRGLIADVFVKSEINHVSLIKSKKGAIRGNHFHMNSIQSILVTKGILEYWFADSNSDNRSDMVLCTEGDLITSPPGEIHTMRTLSEESEFISFTVGKRGGADFESDTFRVENIIRD